MTHTPSVSVGLYPQPPAACLEQQQRETVGSQSSWQGGRAEGETVGERKEEGRDEVEGHGYFLVFLGFEGLPKPDTAKKIRSNVKTREN